MRIRTLTVIALAATCVAAQAQWSMWPPGWPWNWNSYLPFDSPSGPLHQNGTSEEIQVSGTYSYTFYDQVTGAMTQAPPWTAPYGSLYNYSEPIVRSCSGYTLPALKQGKVYDKLYVSEGAQTWFDGETLYTRDRLVYIMSVPGYFDIWDFTGGGGGGG
jgi:hypothetical protein